MECSKKVQVTFDDHSITPSILNFRGINMFSKGGINSTKRNIPKNVIVLGVVATEHYFHVICFDYCLVFLFVNVLVTAESMKQ